MISIRNININDKLVLKNTTNKNYTVFGAYNGDLNDLTKYVDYSEVENNKEKVNDVDIFEFDLSNNVKGMEVYSNE